MADLKNVHQLDASHLAETSRCRILIVEDESTIARNCVTFFELQGYSVDVAHDGPAAIARLTGNTFDVVVLDLGLPRLDGKRVLDHLRSQLVLAPPVLILTARDELDSKLACFALGADDYLDEAIFTSRACRRGSRRCIDGPPVRWSQMLRRPDALRLDRRTRLVTVAGVPVHLPPRPMHILDCLLRDPGRVVTRIELEALLWPDGERESDVCAARFIYCGARCRTRVTTDSKRCTASAIGFASEGASA